MLTLAPHMQQNEKRRFVDGMLMIQLLASLSLFVLFILVGLLLHGHIVFYSRPCLLIFACCTGTSQLQDWLRRYYFLYGKGRLAIVSDFISYGLQFTALLLVWRLGHLTLFVTFLVMCTTSAAAFAIGPMTECFRPSPRLLRETWKRCKHLSRDLLMASQISWFGNQGVLLIATWIVGAAAIGGLRATYTIAGPVYLVLSSLDNVIPMKIAEELHHKGSAGTYKFILRSIQLGTLAFVLLLLPIAIYGRSILTLVYGPALVVFYVPLLLQLSGVIMQVSSRLWIFLYRGLLDTRAVVRANIVSVVFALVTVYSFGRWWGATGIALSGLFSQCAVVVYCVGYWHLHRLDLLGRHVPVSVRPKHEEYT